MTYDTINDAQTVAGNGEGMILAGRYRVVRQLGAGGMGSVWLAEDTQLDNKQFAVKMLPAILVANKRAYRQLKDEALVAMRLVHPNIVQIRAFEENNGNPFLVMDYIDGQTLDDYLADYDSRVEHVERVEGVGNGDPTAPHGRAGSPLPAETGRARSPSGPQGGIPEADVLRILRPIAAALDYAHGEGVVHRDVKPANVMIRKDGHPFILDFGIAREIQETMTRVTGKLSSGTLLYMGPEQLRGQPPKAAQDVYSFAAMAYECIKGEPPFSRGQIDFQILNEEPESLVGRAALSAPLAASIMAGLAKKPEDRPRNCAAVLEGDEVVSRRGAEAQRNLNGCAESVGRGAPTAPKTAPDFSRVEHVERVESAGSRAPALRSLGEGGPRDRVDVPPVHSHANAATAEEEAKRSRAETKIRMLRLKQISDDDGFAKRKSELNDAFQEADIFFESELWADAASRFAECSRQVENLEKLDSERKIAKEGREKAAAAQSGAKYAQGEKYAAAEWENAMRLLSDGEAAYGQMEFAGAIAAFSDSAAGFSKSEHKAIEERKAREEAERKAREEAERKAREEAERQARDDGDGKTPRKEAKGLVVLLGLAVIGGLLLAMTGVKEISPTQSEKGVRRKVQLWADGPYWACKNIGAEEPWESGYYFWWGDTVGYKREGSAWVASDGSESNFSFCEANTLTYGKSHDALKSEGWITEEGVLTPSHDAAKKHWGENWRMPTKQEFEALISRCDWKWAKMNGVHGYEVRGKGHYASASIFLPAASHGNGTSLYYAGLNGYYWSSVPYSGSDYYSWYLSFSSSCHYTYYGCSRYYGQSIRPVQGFTK